MGVVIIERFVGVIEFIRRLAGSGLVSVVCCKLQ